VAQELGRSTSISWAESFARARPKETTAIPANQLDQLSPETNPFPKKKKPTPRIGRFTTLTHH